VFVSLVSFLALYLVMALATTPPAPKCVHYEPDTSVISGRLHRRTFPGPPNFESIAAGDAAETGYYLDLAVPICVESGDAARRAEQRRNVRRVQLVLDADGVRRLRPRLGRRVTLRGTVFSAESGHHHAPILLRVAWPDR
jgi:hypothetical protein